MSATGEDRQMAGEPIPPLGSVSFTTPDTRPRCGARKDGYTCGLEQGHVTAWHEHFREVGGSMVWATDAQPAPAPSGDDARGCEAGQFCTLPALHDGDHSFVAVPQEARERMEWWKGVALDDARKLGAAEARLREVEGALGEIVLAHTRSLDVIRSRGVVFTDIGNDPKNWQHVAFTLYSDLADMAQTANAALEDAAASRPVPVAPHEWKEGDCLTCTKSRDEHTISQDFDFSADGHIYRPFHAPAATPSTDEEGHR